MTKNPFNALHTFQSSGEFYSLPQLEAQGVGAISRLPISIRILLESVRDWAAKGAMLLGVRAVIAESFERIHRSNLIGMGVLPCRFKAGINAHTLSLDGSETFDLIGLKDGMEPREDLTLIVHRKNGETIDLPLTLRIETPVEVEYYRHGGILPYVLRQLLRKPQP